MPPEPTLLNDLLLARYCACNSEIQRHSIQRDALTAIGIIIVVGAYAAGVYALIIPLLLFYLASKWHQHDRRVNLATRYKRDVLEPKMSEHDSIQGYESWISDHELDKQRFKLPNIANRAFFPILQVASIILGLVRYLASKHGPVITALVVLAVIAGIGIAVLTWITLKRHRTPPAPEAPTQSAEKATRVV